MIEIKVSVELPGIPEAIVKLADALSNRPLIAEPVKPAPIVNDEVKKPSARRRAAEKAAVDASTSTPAPSANADSQKNEPVQQVENQAPVQQAEQATQKQYTLDEVCKAGVSLMDRGMINELMGLLKKYNIQSLASATPDMLNGIAADLHAMGADFQEG